MKPNLLALDWGTSSLRGALLDEDGHVIDERSLPRGILTVPAGGFDAVFNESFGDWAAQTDLCLISGMAGSRQGWAEAPYCPCPAGFDELAQHLHWLRARGSGTTAIAIVPGLSCMQDNVPDAVPHGGTPDVMRGEEVQIFGAMQQLGMDSGSFVLPGTHSKWATVRGGRVTGFRTYMTGEVYALLSQHSILARTLQADAPFAEKAFLDGVAHAQSGAGLLHTAFSARTLSLFDRMSGDALASYLSGLVIGEELVAQDLPRGASVVLVGSELLCGRYKAALSLLGAQATLPQGNATWAGLHAVSQSIR